MQGGKDFANTGTQSYELGAEEKVADKKNREEIILNIMDDDSPALLEKSKVSYRDYYSGNFLKDLYYRINNFFIEHSKIKAEVKAQFFHLLSVLIDSGIPVTQGLKSLSAQLEQSPRMANIIENLAKEIENGNSLSEAMVTYNEVFSEQEVGMVQAGEASGQLAKVLENLAKDAEKAYEIRAKVKSAMMYPVIIFILLIAVIAAMMIYVVPKLKSIFSSMGADLPLLTKIVVGTSDFFVMYKMHMAIGLLVFALVFVGFKRTSSGRYMIDKLKLRLPIFGDLFMKAYLSRFSRSLSNLLDSNVTILRTLEICSDSVGNEVYRRRILMAQEDIKQGIPLAENLTDSDLFPPMMVNMIDVGEKTAQMPEITNKVALFYENEVDTKVNGISKIIEPVVLIIIGVTVGIVVAAIMLPIMQLSDFAGAM